MKTNFTKMFLTLAVAFCTVAAFAYDIGDTDNSDQAGDIVATLDATTGVLTISQSGGSGATKSYTTGNGPFNGLSFTTVVVETGVTKLGDYLFEGVTGLT
ncbi:MAG: hypothetical protein LBC40_06935, partial [Dysgonamonadaceae bacterium]|nr:hypothetical protein [Dysgonamonadaceae bacterium]